MYSGRLDADSGVLRGGRGGPRRARRAAAAAIDRPRCSTAWRRRCTEGPGAGVPPLRLALAARSANEALDGHEEIMRWLLLSPVVQSMAVFELWDDDAFHALATRAVRLARDTGALAMLPVALVYRSGVHVFAGEFAAASALIEEADAIARRDRQRRASCTPGSLARRLARRRSRGHGADQRRPRERDAARRGKGAGAGRLCDRHPQQRPGPLRGGRRRRQARQRRRRLGVRRRVAAGARRGGSSLPAGRRSPPPRCPGWKSGHAPRARIGRSASWHAHGR